MGDLIIVGFDWSEFIIYNKWAYKLNNVAGVVLLHGGRKVNYLCFVAKTRSVAGSGAAPR
jgi:hypothetical protein